MYVESGEEAFCELPLNDLDAHVNHEMASFYRAHKIRARFSQRRTWTGQTYFRWCFSDDLAYCLEALHSGDRHGFAHPVTIRFRPRLVFRAHGSTVFLAKSEPDHADHDRT
jgi:hypothetical protein